jgi:hypothetical protein
VPRVIQVIQSEIKRGAGVESNPIRIVTQYHTLDGEMLAESDPWLSASPVDSQEKS